MEIIQRYIEKNTNEDYYCCTWGLLNETLHPIVVAGGALGIIRIFDIYQVDTYAVLEGHGCDINSVRFGPSNQDLLFSVF